VTSRMGPDGSWQLKVAWLGSHQEAHWLLNADYDAAHFPPQYWAKLDVRGTAPQFAGPHRFLLAAIRPVQKPPLGPGLPDGIVVHHVTVLMPSAPARLDKSPDVIPRAAIAGEKQKTGRSGHAAYLAPSCRRGRPRPRWARRNGIYKLWFGLTFEIQHCPPSTYRCGPVSATDNGIVGAGLLASKTSAHAASGAIRLGRSERSARSLKLWFTPLA